MIRQWLIIWLVGHYLDEGRPWPWWARLWIRHDAKAASIADRLTALDTLLSLPEPWPLHRLERYPIGGPLAFTWPPLRWELAAAFVALIGALVLWGSPEAPLPAPSPLAALPPTLQDQEALRAKLIALHDQTRQVLQNVSFDMPVEPAEASKLFDTLVAQTRADGQRFQGALTSLV